METAYPLLEPFYLQLKGRFVEKFTYIQNVSVLMFSGWIFKFIDVLFKFKVY